MKENKKIIKTILVLPLVLGLFFFWFFAQESPVSAQTASLVATVSVNPLTLDLFAPASVSQGDSFKLRVEIGNLGQSKIEKVKASIFIDSGLIVRGKEEKKAGTIQGESQKTVAWRIKAVGDPTVYIIQVEVRGIVKETGGLATISRTVKVTISPQTSLLSRLRRFLLRV